jgi:hypothetical protein
MKPLLFQHRIAALIVSILLGLCTTTAQATIPAGERTTLLDIYASTNGASWTTSTSWNGAVGTECSWYGIDCDAGQTTVTGIHLSGNNLTGSLPAIAGLPNLKAFDVSVNFLTGSIPAISSLSGLIDFLVDHNQLTGSIPAISGLTNLDVFLVFDNQLTGTIPALTGLPNLSVFWANDNQLSGPIPALSGLTNLQDIIIRTNQLTGTIPPLTGLTKLQTFSVGQNLLSGTIPAVPSPDGLLPVQSFVCPNGLDHTPDPAWDAATGVTPWYTDCVVAPTATTNAATAVNRTGATLNGVVTADSASTTVLFGYGMTIAYGTSVAATQSPLTGSATDAAVSVTINGLTCNTLYHFHVTADNGTGGTIDGGDQTFMTSGCLVITPIPTLSDAMLLWLGALLIGFAFASLRARRNH